MHCKNFSLVDTGNGEYALAPAYDLLAVQLADPHDTEEMAMSLFLSRQSTVSSIHKYVAVCRASVGLHR